MKLKSGEEITIKEFFNRWKIGIENITPLQKMSNESRATLLTLIGYIVSMIAVIWFREKIGVLAYGLILIFLGSIWSTGLKYIGLRQQVKLFKNLEKEFNSQQEVKKIETDSSNEFHLETQNIVGEENKFEQMPTATDNQLPAETNSEEMKGGKEQ